MHGTPLITTIALGLGFALVLGFLAARLKLPALVGYLVAGILIGPYTPGLVADMEIARQLAEIGVILLMFGVGLHFSLDDLLEVRNIALPGAILQITVATALGAALALTWGWPPGAAAVFGLALSVASTVVLLRALEAQGVLDSMNGRIAVGWLIVEDLAMVLVLVLLPVAAGSPPRVGGERAGPVWQVVGLTVLEVSVFIALMLLVGRRVVPRLLRHVARTGTREIFTLSVVATAVGVAYVAASLFGASFALGAFFAGMVMRESEFSERAARESLPLREAFSVLFFVSVGMLFDPAVVLEQPLRLLAVLAIVIVGKSVAAAVLVLAFRYPLKTALIVSVSLAQIGEFTFILAGLAVALGVLPAEGQSLILAAALLSIALNPLLFAALGPAHGWLVRSSRLARALDQPENALAELPTTTDSRYLSGHVVLVGYGRVGRRIGECLRKAGIPFVVAEQNREIVERLRGAGQPAVWGNAGDPAVLVQAHVARASMLIVATPDTFDVHAAVRRARALNPGIETVLRTHSDDEAALFEREAVGQVFVGEDELAGGMVRHVLRRYGRAPGSPD